MSQVCLEGHGEAREEQGESSKEFLDQDPPNVEIYCFYMDVNSIKVGEEASVRFIAEVFAETALADGEVILYQDDEVLGIMCDNGSNGDESAGDGVYTYQALLSSETECTRTYQLKVREAVSEARNIGFYIPMTDEELNGMQLVDEALEELCKSDEYSELSKKERAERVREVLTGLAEEGLVVPESIYETDWRVSFEYACGAFGGVLLEEFREYMNLK